MGYSPWGCKESDMTEQLTQLRIAKLFSKRDVLIYFPTSKVYHFLSVCSSIIYEMFTDLIDRQKSYFQFFNLHFLLLLWLTLSPKVCTFFFFFLIYASAMGPCWAFQNKSLGFVLVTG